MNGYKVLSAEMLAAMAASSARAFRFLEINDTYFFTDLPGENYTLDGNEYVYCPMEHSGFSLSTTSPLAEGTIRLGNVDRAISALILGGDLTDANILLYEVFFNDDWTVIDGTLRAAGVIDGMKGAGEWAELSISPFTFGWKTPSPRRIFGRACGWGFKDADCGYAGASTLCSKTYESCTALANTANFSTTKNFPKKGTVMGWGKYQIVIG